MKTTLTTGLFLLTFALNSLALGDVKYHSKTNLLNFDVVEDVSRFVFSKDPVFEDGFPAYGNAFITQGYIYPEGFLDTVEGVTENGEPTHPEQVIGTWTCRGYFIGNGAYTASGPIVITTQTYEFYDTPGYEPGKHSTENLLMSEGYELADIDLPFKRVLTGGTGRFNRNNGEIIQTFMGFNPYMGVRLRFTLKTLGTDSRD